MKETPSIYGPQTVPEPFHQDRDKRNKWYGSIKTLVSTNLYACKIIEMKAGGQSSLEFHVNKTETYLILKGELKVGFRIGKARNCSRIVKEGHSITIPPGVMHIRIALKDTTILEVSTPDDDADSHIVEDGRKYKHVEGWITNDADGIEEDK